jgi:hypothetical protein
MTIHWESLVTVFAVSLGATLAVVALVATGLRGLSARRWTISAGSGAAVAGACLVGAAAIVLFGLWVIVAR